MFWFPNKYNLVSLYHKLFFIISKLILCNNKSTAQD